MPGLKHIRGILYEEYPDMPNSEDYIFENTSENTFEKIVEKSSPKVVDEVDNFPMKCQECGLQKKTIKGLKMHIKLLHLRTGKFLCRRCQFSANMLNSINTHYKIKHAEEKPDYEERSDDKMNFSHEFWKENWGIPTLAERKSIVAKRKNPEDLPAAKKKRKMGKNQAKKQGKKRKIIEEISLIEPEAKKPEIATEISEQKPLNVMEISPFESKLTYKCQLCSKRTNYLDKCQAHLKSEHNTTEPNYKTLSRDQVVDMLTLNFSQNGKENLGFICYFCEDVIGTIYDIKSHFEAEHGHDANFKVKKVQDACKKPVNGYLECQICGYLSPGFDRSKQRVHFHDEHPLEQNINCSKYVLRAKNTHFVQPKIESFDPLKYFGMMMKCPKEDCSFENTSSPAINAHLRKHTQTFKCGHCGKTHPNSSEFHRHSAMVHGDK